LEALRPPAQGKSCAFAAKAWLVEAEEEAEEEEEDSSV
jgi:hypothetical protein